MRHELTAGQGLASERVTSGHLVAFLLGAFLAFIASRIAPPMAGRALGSVRAMAGTDPFAALAQDHRKLLALFERIEASGSSTVRSALLLQLKRMLSAHALAEENIVYPMLREDAGHHEEATRLYREHAEMKVRLFELEHKAKGDPSWIEDIRALHRIVEEHAHAEEQSEFPRLRAALDHRQAANLLSEVHREKAMLL
jgi:hemerythrin superfamily protein